MGGDGFAFHGQSEVVFRVSAYQSMHDEGIQYLVGYQAIIFYGIGIVVDAEDRQFDPWMIEETSVSRFSGGTSPDRAADGIRARRIITPHTEAV